MKTIAVLLTAILAVLSLAACGRAQAEPAEESNPGTKGSVFDQTNEFGGALPEHSGSLFDQTNEFGAALPEQPGTAFDRTNEFGGISLAPGLSDREARQAKEHAQVLTEHLVNRVLGQEQVVHGEEPTDKELYFFITTLPGYMDNPGHPYHSAVSQTPQSLYTFPREGVAQIAYELFGLESWTFDSTLEYNPPADQYESGLEFGTGRNSYLCTQPQAVYREDSGIVEVSFQLEGSASVNGDPGWVDLGRYAVRYQVMVGNTVFLRYQGIQAAQ